MKYFSGKGLDLSLFSLGTVQLGMDYGLGPDTAKPSTEMAFELLDRAMELGVNNLDTANNYGVSESVIGQWLSRRRSAQQPTPWIVTKIGPLKHGSYDILRDDILRQTDGCCKTLGMETLDCLMIHNFEDYEQDPDAISKVFAELKADGRIRLSALSAYSRHDYGVIADSGFDATQIPMNVFDWSQIESGGMKRLSDSGMLIFVRSVFLQGLVFLRPEDVDPRMDFCVPYLKRYLALSEEFGLSPAVLAMSFVLSIPGVSTLVLGCQRIGQMIADCDLIEQTVKLTDSQMEKLHAAFTGIDPRVINPGVWFNHT